MKDREEDSHESCDCFFLRKKNWKLLEAEFMKNEHTRTVIIECK